jgi:predicted nucleic acid-binding protein
MDRILADTGVWYAMFEPGNRDRDEIRKMAEILDVCRLVVPWPTMYETLRTRMMRKRDVTQRLENYLKRPNLEYLDDSPYREEALRLAFWWSSRGRPLSMVDCLIRLLLDDIEVKVNVLATLNLRDFIDVCQRRRIELI